ncbi:hypothetical protein GJ496_010565 [Pomphorhynchus laevis]|nr:hypothetical protein GJ496_010565 [Pomphorhynchus laevis]
MNVHSAHEGIVSSSVLFRELGNIFYLSGDCEEAMLAYTNAINIDSSDYTTMENLSFCLHHILPAWHFRMLNDNVRNLNYMRAIQEMFDKIQVIDNMKLLEIGSGTGLLTMLALKSGFSSVTAVEQSRFLSGVTQTVIEKNSYCEQLQVEVQNISSFDMPAEPKYNILITELFDCSLLGEHFFSVLRDLQTRQILSRNHLILPKSACLHIGVYECSKLRSSNYWQSSNGLRFRRLLQKPNVLNFEFTDSVQLDAILSGQWKQNVRLTFKQSANTILLDVIAVWFTLNLTDEITISSGLCDDCNLCTCWQQAVYPITKRLPMSSFNDLGYIECQLTCKQVDNNEVTSEYLDVSIINSTVDSDNEICDVFISSSNLQRLHRQDYQYAFIHDISSSFQHHPLLIITDSVMELMLSIKNDYALVLSNARSEAYDFLTKHKPTNVVIIDLSRDDWAKNFPNIDTVKLIYEPCDLAGQIYRNIISNIHTVSQSFRIESAVPKLFRVLGFLAECDQLRKEVYVDEPVVNSFNIHDEINVFTPTMIFDIDTAVYTFKRLSKVCELFTFNDFQNLTIDQNIQLEIPVTKSGHFDVLFYYFQMEFCSCTIDSLLENDETESRFRLAGIRNGGKSMEVSIGDKINAKLQRKDHFILGSFLRNH